MRAMGDIDTMEILHNVIRVVFFIEGLTQSKRYRTNINGYTLTNLRFGTKVKFKLTTAKICIS